MDLSNVQSMVDQLEENTDDLEEILQPAISQSLSESSKKLPLLDKAKLHIVIVYAIESLLFSYLKLHGVDAKEHPVFRELTRVKQYFEKLKVAEEGPTQLKDNLSLDKQAAVRIIKHSLAGNDQIDLERLEREARGKLLARRKLKDLEATMKEKAQSLEQEPQSVEEQLVNQIAAEIEQNEDVPTDNVTADAHEDTKQSQDKKRKRKGESSSTKRHKKSEQSEGKAAKKARKRAKKDARASAQPAG